MKISLAGKNMRLTLALALALPCAAFAEKRQPVFRLNYTRVYSLPGLPDGGIPEVPPPTDTGYYSRGNSGGLRLDSSVKVVIDNAGGRAEIKFPGSESGEESYGFTSSLFVKFAVHNTAPVLSWATIVCAGRQYLGYKGSDLKFPDKAGAFVLKDESLSLGPAKNLLGRTHPWILLAAESGVTRDPDRLCSAGFPKNAGGYSVKALPREAGGYSFKYDRAKNALTVTWQK